MIFTSEILENKSPHTFDIPVGRRIRHFRLLREMTQMGLGKQIGTTFQQIQKYETGFNRVSASRLWMIAEVLEVGVEDLFGDELIQRLEGKV